MTFENNATKIFIQSIDDNSIIVTAQYNPKELSVELLFDAVEGGSRSVDVAKSVKDLETLASVIEPGSAQEDRRRPHRCVCTWGTTLDSFRCVIESLSTKYTMFDAKGAPLRATCTVKLKEADVVSMGKAGGK